MRILTLVGLFAILLLKVQAQDLQLSQYYNAPLYLNPALTGSTDCYRVGINARTQWAGLNGAYNTGVLFADMNYNDLRSGFGIMAINDVSGVSKLTSREFSALYSFLIPVADQVNIRLGLQGTYVVKSVNYNQMVFEDQYTGTQITEDRSTDPLLEFNQKKYADFSSGVLVYGDDTYWLGFSAHHLNRPEQAFYKPDSRLPIKFSFHGGYNIHFKKIRGSRISTSSRLIPTFMYKAQGKFDQADLGIYYLKYQFLLGIWYRGILIKQDEKILNNDAIIAQVGYKFKNISLTYSFDYTTSKLALANTSGSHELSLIYTFCASWPPRKKPIMKRLPCPDFQKSIR